MIWINLAFFFVLNLLAWSREDNRLRFLLFIIILLAGSLYYHVTDVLLGQALYDDPNPDQIQPGIRPEFFDKSGSWIFSLLQGLWGSFLISVFWWGVIDVASNIYLATKHVWTTHLQKLMKG